MLALNFLLQSLGNFFIALFLLRFLMQCLRVPFRNPLGAFVIALSSWAVLPLRRVLPGFGGFDWASLLAALVLQFFLLWLLFFINSPLEPDFFWLLVSSLRALLQLSIYIFIGALIAQALLSWISPYAPMAAILWQFTKALLTPVQRVLPPIAGVDLSPLVIIVLLQLILLYV